MRRADSQSGGCGRSREGFTLIELLIVMAIILVLAGLIIGTSGYVQKKAGRSRAEAEVAALSAALESYKADNGIYPTDADSTEKLDARTATDPSSYKASSFVLYQQLSAKNADGTSVANSKSYFAFKPQMLAGERDSNGNIKAVTGARDPFGNFYGYSTLKAANPAATGGYNPTFDLWSTANSTDQTQWVKNW